VPPEDLDLAHPEAADWVLGSLGPAETEEFGHHLASCRHCQAVVAEFGQLGQMLQHLPPPAEPPPDLEARTVASVLAAATAQRAAVAADDQAVTQVYQVPRASPPAAEPESTQAFSIPPGPPELAHDERPAGAGAKIIRFPRWHGRAGLLSIAGAVAAAIIAAVVILPGLGRSVPAGAVTFKLASHSGASGTAVARQDASGSWDITLSVQHLPSGEEPFYECWYVSPGHRQVVSAGTFIVGKNGSGTFSMTTAVDPHDFPVMEITRESPSNNGAYNGAVVLTSRKL
jgi:hypothetical protein